MNKKILIFLCFVLLILVSWGCGKAGYPDDYLPGENETEQRNLNLSERKIIYYISSDLIVESLDNAIEAIHNAKKVDEWFESEKIYPKRADLTIRIKSSRIDEFKDTLKQIGKLENYTLTATDISLEYSGTQESIASYQAERARLLELYNNARVDEMIEINRRLREIDTELSRLNRKQNEFDSLIEYSSITLSITGTKDDSKRSFGQMAKSAFTGGLDAFITFFQYVIIVIIAVFPFALIIVPLIFIIKKYNERKQNKDN